MKYTPYESPFVREARKKALERAKMAQKSKRKQSSTHSPDHNTRQPVISVSVPATPRRQARAVQSKPWTSEWNSSATNAGLFDPSLKKVEIFKVQPRSEVRTRRVYDDDDNSDTEILETYNSSSPSDIHTWRKTGAVETHSRNQTLISPKGHSHNEEQARHRETYFEVEDRRGQSTREVTQEQVPYSPPANNVHTGHDHLPGEKATRNTNDHASFLSPGSSAVNGFVGDVKYDAVRSDNDADEVRKANALNTERCTDIKKGVPPFAQRASSCVGFTETSTDVIVPTSRTEYATRSTSPISTNTLRRLLPESEPVRSKSSKQRRQISQQKSAERCTTTRGTSAMDALSRALSDISKHQKISDQLQVAATQNLLQSVALLTAQQSNVPNSMVKNSVKPKNGNIAVTNLSYRAATTQPDSPHNGPCCVARTENNAPEKNIIAQQLLHKLQILEEKEKQISSFLDVPQPPRGRPAGETAPAITSNSMNFVSLPGSNYRGGKLQSASIPSIYDEGLRQKLELSSTIGVNAPQIHNTFEVTARFDQDDMDGMTSGENNKGGECVDMDNVGWNLPLLQYAPGPREEILRYRRKLKRSNVSRAFMSHQDQGLSVCEIADRLTEVLLTGLLEDVSVELDTLFADIATKVVCKI